MKDWKGNANPYERFEILKLKRNEFKGADYNPRKITEEAKKKLQRFLKNNGLWSPIVINKRTMTIISGHQRVAILDNLIKKTDYELTVSLVDVDEKLEATGNVFMNNASAQGEWDTFALQDLRDIFPDIDYVDDFGFDESEIDIMLGDILKDSEPESVGAMIDPMKEAKKLSAEDFRQMKQDQRDKAKAENETGKSYNLEEADYVVQVVFPNNREKADFMRKIKKAPTEKYIKSTVLFDISKGVYDLSVFNS
jgi:hypothetical protein